MSFMGGGKEWTVAAASPICHLPPIRSISAVRGGQKIQRTEPPPPLQSMV